MVFINAVASQASRRQVKWISSLNKYLVNCIKIENVINFIHSNFKSKTNNITPDNKIINKVELKQGKIKQIKGNIEHTSGFFCISAVRAPMDPG